MKRTRGLLVGVVLVGMASACRNETASPSPNNDAPRPSLSTTSTGSWGSVASMMVARDNLAVGVVNAILYAVGGDDGGCGVLGSVEAYDPTTNTWTSKASLGTPRYDAATGTVNGILYAVGGRPFGCNSTAVAGMEAYDPATDSWSPTAPMPGGARFVLGAGVINGILYAVGGETAGLALSRLEAYDPTTDTWVTKAPMPTARSSVEAGVVNGILYVVGGGTNCCGGVATVEAYDPATNTWATKAPMSTPRSSFALAVADGILYAFGGQGCCSQLASVEAYDPATDAWTPMPPLPLAIQQVNFAAGVVNGVAYVVGGNGCCGTVGVVQAFTPAPMSKTDQTISFAPLADKTFGDPSFAVSATASSGLTVTFTASGNCTIAANIVSITGPGSCTVTGHQPGDSNFNPAADVAQSFAVLYNTAAGHSFLQPINMPPQQQSVFKINSTIPVKFRLFLADGVTPVSTASATIQVNKVSSGLPSPVNESVVSTVPNQGVSFRYDSASQQYIFNLGTKNWTPGVYRITANLDDGSVITVDVGAR